MRNRILITGVAALLLAGCKTSEKTTATKKEPVIQTLGSHPVYTSEFEYVYAKNNSTAENAYSRQSITEYLDLYTNFKLKVIEAESRGMDTTSAFKRELDGYRQQLAQPYLTDKSVTDKLVKEAYERMKQEVNASHILITVAPDAEPKDTLAAYNLTLSVRDRITKGGESFEAVAMEVSQDPSAAENGGRLGYFTALQMVYPFEDAAYKTPPGQISAPVRTRYGYHLVKVNDVRPAQGEAKVAHIMIRATPGMPVADSIAAKKKIDEIYRKTQKEDWTKLASQFSEDAGSAQNGGELPWFGTGRLHPALEEAAFNLKNPGDISAPVNTQYGWHVLKLIERRSLPAYADMEPSLKSKVAKDSRSELNKAAFLKKIKAENKFQEYKPARDLAFSKADASLTEGTWQFNEQDKALNAPLFSIQDRKYTIKDFYGYAKLRQQPRQNVSPAHAMQTLYDGFVETSLMDYEKANLENKHVDYRMLVKEYRDGILLFQLMDEKVWSKAIEDTTGLKRFFEENKEKYKWDTRASATIISAANKDVLARAQSQLKASRYPVTKNVPQDVLFENNSATLSKAATVKLEEMAHRLETDTTLTLVINGHISGNEKAALATQRAEAIKQYFRNHNIASHQLETKALGKTKPAGNDKTAAGQKANRRASFSLFSTDTKAIEESLNEKNPLAVQIAKRKFQKGDNKILDGVNWQPGTYNVEQDGRVYFIQIDAIEPPTYKQLNEARGIATSDYQAHLEKEWVDELRKKYPVVVNQAEVDKLVKK